MSRGKVVNAFDPFGEEEGDDFVNQTAGWSSETWGNAADTSALDSTFDSTTLFDFSTTGDQVESNSLFPDDPMGSSAGKDPTVHVAIKEQLACLYDEFSNTSSGRVEGSIFVRPGSKQASNPFCLVVRDERSHLARLQQDPAVCHDISYNIARNSKRALSLQPNDRVLRVTLSNAVSHSTPVATYVCNSALRPIPMLVKTRVQVDRQFCNVGIRIRSNPSNDVPLTNLAILLAVPPDLNGETVKILKQAGIWDGMKRVIAWSVEQLDPGEIIELQCQFEFVVVSSDEESKRPAPKFPVLVRCDAVDEQLSDVELNTDYTDDLSNPVKMNLSRSVRILHRKV